MDRELQILFKNDDYYCLFHRRDIDFQAQVPLITQKFASVFLLMCYCEQNIERYLIDILLTMYNSPELHGLLLSAMKYCQTI